MIIRMSSGAKEPRNCESGAVSWLSKGVSDSRSEGLLDQLNLREVQGRAAGQPAAGEGQCCIVLSGARRMCQNENGRSSLR